ncbi:MAG: hypothetical protein GY719_19705 [bacterium]|nr:hypothetical protein [bacterium]
MPRIARSALNRLLAVASVLCSTPCVAMAAQDDQAIRDLLQQGTGSAQPGKVVLAPGVWTINSTIVIDSGGVIIEGEGETILRASAQLGTDPIFHIPNDNPGIHRTNITFRSLWFRGLDSTLDPFTDATGIEIGSGSGGTVRNVVVKECRFGSEDGYLANGIYQDGPHVGLGISDSQIEYSENGLWLRNDGHEFLIDRSRFAHNVHGVFAGADTIQQRPEGLRINSSVFIHNEFGIYAENLIWGSLSSTDFDYGQTTDGVGIYAESWYNVRVESCEFIGGAESAPGKHAVWINGEIVRSRFTNNIFGHSSKKTVLVQGPAGSPHVDVSFIGNWFPSANAVYILDATRLQITNNNFAHYAGGGTAIVVVDSEDVVIANNTVLRHGHGFWIADSDRVAVANNMISYIEYHGISFIEGLGDRPAIYTASGNIVIQSGSGVNFFGANSERSVIVSSNNLSDNAFGIINLPANAINSANILP